MTTLTADAILAVNDTPIVPVDVPEWGGVVHIRPMSGRERDAYDMEMVNGGGKAENLRARLAVRIIVNEDGTRMFTDDKAEALGRKSAAALDRIYRAMEQTSRTTAEAVERLKKD